MNEKETLTELKINRKLKDIASAVGVNPNNLDIRNHYKNGYFTKKSIFGVLNIIFNSVIMGENVNILQRLNRLDTLVYDFINEIYNTYGFDYDKYMSFVPTTDLYQITNHPKLKEAKELVRSKPNPKNVKNVYGVLKDVIFNDPQFKNNQVAISYISEAFNTKQANQCLGLRGYPNDIGGEIFNTIISESYSEGLTNFVSSALESRGAVTALFYSSKSIRDAESFAKSTQIVSEYVTTLKYSDCGSKKGITRLVRPPGLNEHSDFYGGDLPNLEGQYYKIKDSDPWKLLRVTDTHLYNKEIILRTTVSCTLKNTKAVCVSCFGRHGYAKKEGFNLGQFSCTKVNEPAVQSLLSAKHFIVSADGGKYSIPLELSKYLKVDDKDVINLTRFYKKYKKVLLKIEYTQSVGLKDLHSISDVERVNPERISKIANLTLELHGAKNYIEALDINISNVKKTSVFSTAFLKYIVSSGYTSDGDFQVIDITNWDYRQPLMFIPRHVFNYNQLVQNVETMIGTSKTLNGEKMLSLERLINETFDLYNTKLSLHISHVATVVYSLSIKNSKDYNYRLSRGIDSEIGTISTITKYRGFSSLASTGTISNMLSIYNIESDVKETHGLDVLFDPQGFLDNYERTHGD